MDSVKIYLDAVRVNTGMNQDEWAQALGVNKSTICSWESGKTQPKFEDVEKMSKLSNIPMQFISVSRNPNK